MENLQEKYKKFFGGICYAFCLVKKFNPSASDAEIAMITLSGWNHKYLEDGGYIKYPVDFVNCFSYKKIKDVTKVPYSLKELTEDVNIVMFEYNGGTHFVCMNKEGDVIFDPSGDSKSVKYGIPVSIRKFVYAV